MVKTLEVKELLKFAQVRHPEVAPPQTQTLSDVLRFATSMTLADKTRKRVRRANWNSMSDMTLEAQTYAALDGIASYICGVMLSRARQSSRRVINKSSPATKSKSTRWSCKQTK